MKRKAFTVMECCVFIAIIGLLLALLIPAILACRNEARKTIAKQEIQQRHNQSNPLFIEGYLTGQNDLRKQMGKGDDAVLFETVYHKGYEAGLASQIEPIQVIDPQNKMPLSRMDGLVKMMVPGDSGWVYYGDIVVTENRCVWIEVDSQVASSFDDIYHDVYVVCEESWRFTIYTGLMEDTKCRSITNDAFESRYKKNTLAISRIVDELPPDYEPELEE